MKRELLGVFMACTGTILECCEVGKDRLPFLQVGTGARRDYVLQVPALHVTSSFNTWWSHCEGVESESSSSRLPLHH